MKKKIKIKKNSSRVCWCKTPNREGPRWESTGLGLETREGREGRRETREDRREKRSVGYVAMLELLTFVCQCVNSVDSKNI